MKTTDIVNITITGPEGCGKTRLAAVLKQLLADEAVDPAEVADINRLLRQNEIRIRTGLDPAENLTDEAFYVPFGGKPEDYPDTPTLDRMRAIKHLTEPQGDLLEWLQEESPFAVCEETAGYEQNEWVPITMTIERLLAEMHGIDLREADREKEAVLQWHRKATGQI